MDNEYNVTYIRWTVRIFLVVLLFQLFAYLYYVTKSPLGFSFNYMKFLSVVKDSGFLIMVLVGAIIAWKREVLGGILITAGLFSFYLLSYTGGRFPCSLLTFTFWPGILSILYGVVAKRYSDTEVKKDTDKSTMSDTLPRSNVAVAS